MSSNNTNAFVVASFASHNMALGSIAAVKMGKMCVQTNVDFFPFILSLFDSGCMLWSLVFDPHRLVPPSNTHRIPLVHIFFDFFFVLLFSHMTLLLLLASIWLLDCSLRISENKTFFFDLWAMFNQSREKWKIMLERSKKKVKIKQYSLFLSRSLPFCFSSGRSSLPLSLDCVHAKGANVKATHKTLENDLQSQTFTQILQTKRQSLSFFAVSIRYLFICQFTSARSFHHFCNWNASFFLSDRHRKPN